MITLSDDCQLIIIKLLNLKEQLNLFEATKEEPTNRWVLNLRYTWQKQQNFFLNMNELIIFNKYPELLHDFLSIISPTVNHLTIYYFTLDVVQRWQIYDFPHMTSLEYCMRDRYELVSGNQYIQLMAKIFPKLHSLKTQGTYDLIHLRNWSHLRKLNMSISYPGAYTFEPTEGILALQMLEELRFSSIDISDEQFKMLVGLPNLQTLITGDDNEVKRLEILTKMRYMDVEKITLMGYYIKAADLNKFIKLRQLILVDAGGFTNDDLRKAVKELPLLERLDILDERVLSSEIELWKTVQLCPSLKFIGLDFVELDFEFFSSSRQPMKMALDKRTSPLTIICDETDDYELICSSFNHPNLNISFDDADPEPDQFEYYNIRFDFYRPTISTDENTC